MFLILFFFFKVPVLLLKCRLCSPKCRFSEKEQKNDENKQKSMIKKKNRKEDETKIKIPRKGSPSCALNSTILCLLACASVPSSEFACVCQRTPLLKTQHENSSKIGAHSEHSRCKNLRQKLENSRSAPIPTYLTNEQITGSESSAYDGTAVYCRCASMGSQNPSPHEPSFYDG